MSRQWLEAYQKGPIAFNQHILNYKPNSQQTRKFKYQKKELDEDINMRYQSSNPNKQYRFPKKPHYTQQSHNSLISVVEYDLKDQNPVFCSFKRCLRSNQLSRSTRDINQPFNGSIFRSKSRKILGVSKVKEIVKNSKSKSKKKRKVQVREIHLLSTNQQNSQFPLVNLKKLSNKKFIASVKMKNQRLNNSKCSNSNSIRIVNKPRQGTPNSHYLSTLQQQSKLCQQKICKSPTNYSSGKKNIRYLTNRPAPNIRTLVIQKRQIKILTSESFNNRRSKDKIIKLPRDTSSSYKTLGETKKSLLNRH